MNDLYKPPAAEIENPSDSTAGDFQLYKVSGVGLATFLGTPIAGGILMAKNFQRLGNRAAAKKTLLLSILATITVFILAYFIPETLEISGIALTMPQLLIMIMLTKQLQESDIKQHEEFGGAMASNWKAFGVAIVVVLIIFAAALPSVFFFDSSPAL